MSMNLQQAIEQAAAISYEEDSGQIVGRIQGDWAIADSEDWGRQCEMDREPRFCVNASGVDQGHIERGEITENWNLPDGE